MTTKLTILTIAVGSCLAMAWNARSESSTMPAENEPQTPLKPKPKRKIELKKIYDTKPLEKSADVRWAHAPYLHGDCSICHISNDHKDPGKLRAESKKLCLSCHEPTKTMLRSREHVHEPVDKDCSYCHNPHNSKYRLLLYRAPGELCGGCHKEMSKLINGSAVKHDPALKGNTCRNCHTAHASSIEHLLLGLPSDLCLKCHGKRGLKDASGRELINIGKLIEKNRFRHEPVVKKDCSACHAAHGSEHFRLLIKRYPKEFYAAYSKENFALCFGCHAKEQSISQAETETLTGFRDGKRNLHAVHVSLPKRGRTCRACHGEHAAEHEHMIRKSVPFGKKGWELDINYVKTKTGGRCMKTCHSTKEYKNK